MVIPGDPDYVNGKPLSDEHPDEAMTDERLRYGETLEEADARRAADPDEDKMQALRGKVHRSTLALKALQENPDPRIAGIKDPVTFVVVVDETYEAARADSMPGTVTLEAKRVIEIISENERRTLHGGETMWSKSLRPGEYDLEMEYRTNYTQPGGLKIDLVVSGPLKPGELSGVKTLETTFPEDQKKGVKFSFMSSRPFNLAIKNLSKDDSSIEKLILTEVPSGAGGADPTGQAGASQTETTHAGGFVPGPRVGVGGDMSGSGTATATPGDSSKP